MAHSLNEIVIFKERNNLKSRRKLVQLREFLAYTLATCSLFALWACNHDVNQHQISKFHLLQYFCSLNFLQTLPRNGSIGRVKDRIHKPSCKHHYPWAIRYNLLSCVLNMQTTLYPNSSECNIHMQKLLMREFIILSHFHNVSITLMSTKNVFHF